MIKKVFIRLLIAIISIFVFNAFQSVFHITLALNIFNVVMIACFDIFGFLLCVFLRIML